jgi:hypothetical protein
MERMQGAEEVKNKNAERITRKIFAQAAWINLHMLPVCIDCLECAPCADRCPVLPA